jgi:uncharacterized protein YcaQ
MEPLIITKAKARAIILNAAGLSQKAQFGTGIEAVFNVIDQLGFIQLDTNYVVERAHHHVMAARIPDYELTWLNDLVEDGRIFEYFSSESGYLPVEDFRYSLVVKNAFAAQRRTLTKPEQNLMRDVLDRVEREGPLMVTDFENDRPAASSGWWDWRPAKIALEWLYLDGKLMIKRTKGFKKIYDLPANILQEDVTLETPTAEEYARYVIRRTLGALGIASAKEIAFRARQVRGNMVKQEIENMVAAAELRRVIVEDLQTTPLYILPDQQTEISLSNEVFILSPFDILNVFRNRLRDFFNFDYQIECFVPEPKRKYGYFSLPILLGDGFIARMDSKADRKKKVLIIHNLHFEPVELNNQGLDKLIDALKAFMQFNNCNKISFAKCNQPQYLQIIRNGLS